MNWCQDDAQRNKDQSRNRGKGLETGSSLKGNERYESKSFDDENVDLKMKWRGMFVYLKCCLPG
jgi:hypothetical protein